MSRTYFAPFILLLTLSGGAHAGELDPMTRPNTVAVEVGLPALLSASYERRLTPSVAAGARLGAGFVLNADAFARLYPLPGHQVEPFFQLNVGYSEFVGGYNQSAVAAGVDFGVRRVATNGLTVSARVGGIVPLVGDLSELAPVIPNASVQLGASF